MASSSSLVQYMAVLDSNEEKDEKEDGDDGEGGSVGDVGSMCCQMSAMRWGQWRQVLLILGIGGVSRVSLIASGHREVVLGVKMRLVFRVSIVAAFVLGFLMRWLGFLLS